MKTIGALWLMAGLLISGSALAQAGNNTAILNPDLAKAEELAGAPHMNAALVAAITGGRPFATMTAVDTALRATLSDAQRKELYGRVFQPINLNTADDAEIALIPGMTPRMVREFKEYRPYKSLEQFRREMGKYVDQKEVARLEQYVFVPMSLNSASAKDFATIPGMTSRMVHEFEEYRPYKDIEQFRREMGKYVDQKEVARLERYVTLD